MTTWHVLAGEYPPGQGGVADHTHELVKALAAAGEHVVVWTSSPDAHQSAQPQVRGDLALWSPAGLARLDALLEAEPGARRLLVPYAPNVYGYRGLNVFVCRWLRRRADAGDDVRLLVHEPFYPWRAIDKPARWLLAAAQRVMLNELLAAAKVVYVATSAWIPMLNGRVAPTTPIFCLPSFSNVPVADPARRAAVRQELCPMSGRLIGSFAVPQTMFRLLRQVVREVVSPACGWTFIGAGSEELTSKLRSSDPGLAPFVSATGRMVPERLSLALQACDLIVQAYPDGVTTRRTTAMACLAHAAPTVATAGALTEPVWHETGAVALCPPDPAALAAGIVELMADETARGSLARRGRATYDSLFAPVNAARILLQDPLPDASRATGVRCAHTAATS